MDAETFEEIKDILSSGRIITDKGIDFERFESFLLAISNDSSSFMNDIHRDISEFLVTLLHDDPHMMDTWTRIPDNMFWHYPYESLTLPDNIVEIGNQAFMNSSNLKTIVFPKALKKIGKAAFAWCTKLESIDLSNTVLVTLGEEVFHHCPSVKTLLLPDTLTNMPFLAFGYLAIEEVTIPKSVKVLNGSCFWDCKQLKRVKLNEGLETIGQFAFDDTKIKRLTLPSTLDEHTLYMIAAIDDFYVEHLSILYVKTKSQYKYLYRNVKWLPGDDGPRIVLLRNADIQK